MRLQAFLCLKMKITPVKGFNFKIGSFMTISVFIRVSRTILHFWKQNDHLIAICMSNPVSFLRLFANITLNALAYLPKEDEILEPGQKCAISGFGYMGYEREWNKLVEKLPETLQELNKIITYLTMSDYP